MAAAAVGHWRRLYWPLGITSSPSSWLVSCNPLAEASTTFPFLRARFACNSNSINLAAVVTCSFTDSPFGPEKVVIVDDEYEVLVKFLFFFGLSIVDGSMGGIALAAVVGDAEDDENCNFSVGGWFWLEL